MKVTATIRSPVFIKTILLWNRGGKEWNTYDWVYPHNWPPTDNDDPFSVYISYRFYNDDTSALWPDRIWNSNWFRWGNLFLACNKIWITNWLHFWFFWLSITSSSPIHSSLFASVTLTRHCNEDSFSVKKYDVIAWVAWLVVNRLVVADTI